MSVGAPSRSTKPAIPPLIRRNTRLLALSQAFTGAGISMVYSIGPLMILAVAGSTALTGLSVTLMGLSRFLVAYPIGRVTDVHGRKPAMLGGLALGLVGALLVGGAALGGLFPLLLAAFLVFGMGMNTAQQLRVAATDMYPPARRAEGLGYVLTGSLVGVLVSPLLISVSQAVAPSLGLDPLGLPWLLFPILILPGMYLVLLVRPDPKEIAQRLADYYPDYRPRERATARVAASVTLRQFLGHRPRRLAVLANVASQGNMAVVMVSSALLLHNHGASLGAVAFSGSLHSMSMWAFSVPIGRLADRVGRRTVLLFGALTATTGAVLATQSPAYWLITLGAVLVGLGWSATNVATTVVIADTTAPAERGRAVGLNDSLTAAVNVLIPLVAGPMGAALGVPSTGLLAAALTLPALVLLLGLHEPTPGQYGDAASVQAAVEERAAPA